MRLHRLWIESTALVAALAAVSAGVWAQSGCEATSANYDQRCAITCKPGEVAACRDSPGSSSPNCYCSAPVDPRRPAAVSQAAPRAGTLMPRRANPDERGAQKN
jgi:hypothetical protein